MRVSRTWRMPLDRASQIVHECCPGLYGRHKSGDHLRRMEALGQYRRREMSAAFQAPCSSSYPKHRRSRMSFSDILPQYDRCGQHVAFGASQWRMQDARRFQRGSSNGLCVTQIRARGIGEVGPEYSLNEWPLALLIRVDVPQGNTGRCDESEIMWAIYLCGDGKSTIPHISVLGCWPWAHVGLSKGEYHEQDCRPG